MRLKTSAFGSMIVTVPIDVSIALANDDAAGSSVTSLPNLRARCSVRHVADRQRLLLNMGGKSVWFFFGKYFSRSVPNP